MHFFNYASKESVTATAGNKLECQATDCFLLTQVEFHIEARQANCLTNGWMSKSSRFFGSASACDFVMSLLVEFF